MRRIFSAFFALSLSAAGCMASGQPAQEGECVSGKCDDPAAGEGSLPGSGAVELLSHWNGHPPEEFEFPPGAPPVVAHIPINYSGIASYARAGREYALLAVPGGLSIIDVTRPGSPEELEFFELAGGYNNRDVVVVGDYAYVGGQQGASLQVIGLRRLPQRADILTRLPAYKDLTHTINADGEHLYLHSVRHGCIIMTLEEPEEPREISRYPQSCHDALVRDGVLYVAAAEDWSYHFVDISNPEQPAPLAYTERERFIYAHSVALSEDSETLFAFEEYNVDDMFIFDLERDEQGRVLEATRVGTFALPGESRLHNGHVRGDYLFLAYYEEGLVVLDVSDPSDPVVVAQYDTWEPESTGGFAGAWNLDTELPSGNVLLSDLNSGLYIFQQL